MGNRITTSARLPAFLMVLMAAGHLIPTHVQGEKPDLAVKLKDRPKLRTPASDELLRELEQDFVGLLQQSNHAEQLLQAEGLLIATNDNTHWTNYSAATRILRRDRDIAAIPLLLRYIVLHSKRSACHVMIPEYRKTIAAISGCELPVLYEAGPDLEARMRSKVSAVVNGWWREAKTSLVTDPTEMSPAQLQVLVTNLLKQVRYNGDFTGSGGKPDSAYRAYHNVYYRVLGSTSEERVEVSPLHPAMIPLLLAPSGYRSERESKPAARGSFPYETVWILAEFAKNGHRAMIEQIADDRQQNATVRMICILSLFRAGQAFKTDSMIEILEHETDLQRRLIAILSLRWAGPPAVPLLLKHMDDPNFEVATAAACALTEAKPPEAIRKFESLLDRHHVSAPLLMYRALAQYQSSEARALFARLLTDAVDGKKNSQHMSRLLDAFADAWDIPRAAYNPQGDRDYRRQAMLALELSREMLKRQQAEITTLAAVVESLQVQLKVAEQIESLRRSEYKRLLGLQGDEIVTAQESQQAHAQIQTVAAEVEPLRSKLVERESKLRALQEK